MSFEPLRVAGRWAVRVLGSYAVHTYVGLGMLAVGAGMWRVQAGLAVAGLGLFYLGAFYGRHGQDR